MDLEPRPHIVINMGFCPGSITSSLCSQAVFLGTMKSQAIGVSIAFAIALHNIPEGVAVALPVYFATGSRCEGRRGVDRRMMR